MTRRQVPIYEFYPPRPRRKVYADETDQIPPFTKVRHPNRRGKQTRQAGKPTVASVLGHVAIVAGSAAVSVDFWWQAASQLH